MAEIDANSPVHKWHQLKTLLLQRIEHQDYDLDEVFCKQHDLMQKHNVSYATVSRALSELVRDGYLYRKRGVGTFVRPRKEPRGVAATIGMLVWDREHILEHPAYSRLVAGISKPLREAGYNLSFIFVNAKATRDGEVAEVVRRAKVRALIAPAQLGLTEDALRPLGRDALPIVPLNLDLPELSPCAVHFDISGAIEAATDHLLSCGYRRVALMVPDTEEASGRIAGYRQALEHAGIHEQLIFTAPTDGPLPPEVRRVLGGFKAPAGLVTSDDIAALTAFRTAREAGWSVPEQLGIIGVGDFLPPELFEAPLTTMHVPFAAMGQLAGEMLMDLLENRMPATPVRRLSARLVVRSTTIDLSARSPVAR